MKTNKKPFDSNFNELGPGKKKPFHLSIWSKKHKNHLDQNVELNRSNIKGHNLHDVIKKVA